MGVSSDKGGCGVDVTGRPEREGVAAREALLAYRRGRITPAPNAPKRSFGPMKRLRSRTRYPDMPAMAPAGPSASTDRQTAFPRGAPRASRPAEQALGKAWPARILQLGLVLFTVCLLYGTPLRTDAQDVTTHISPTQGIGDLGTVVTQQGDVHHITAGTRPNNGPNLFHSFGQFSVGTGDVANFLNDSGLSTNNILSRVTGDARSDIYGTLRTTGFPGAALFLINPNGIVFGPGAELQVEGSFHASTADYLRLADGGLFHATDPGQSTLTVAPPAAFGFLGDSPAPVSVNGSELEVDEGETLSLVGGDVNIDGAVLLAPAGRLQLASAGAAGEVLVTETGLEMGGAGARGAVSLSESTLDVSGDGGGRVEIRGGRFVMAEASEIRADTLGAGNGRGIDVDVERLEMSGGSVIGAETAQGSTGDGGGVVIKTRSAHMEGEAGVFTSTLGAGRGGDLVVDVTNDLILSKYTGLSADTGSRDVQDNTGAGGNFTLHAGSIQMRDGAEITTTTWGDGRGGDLQVEADTVFMSGGEAMYALIGTGSRGSGDAGDVTVDTHALREEDGSGIASTNFAQGGGGDVRVRADSIEVRDSEISSYSFFDATGRGGDVLVEADTVRMLLVSEAFYEYGAGMFAEALGSGDAGNLVVRANRLELGGGAVVSASTLGAGHGGNVRVEADTVLLSGTGNEVDGAIQWISGLFASSDLASGDAGSVTVEARHLEVRDGAQISASTLADGQGGSVQIAADTALLSGGGELSTLTTGPGQGGDITLRAGDISLRDGARISAQSTGTGDAGRVTIVAADTFSSSGSSVTTEAIQAVGGDIELSAGEMVHLIDSAITTSVAGGVGDGGNILIDPVFVILDSSRIQANAYGGKGGNIDIVANHFFASPDSLLEASSQLGIDGVIQIRSPDSDISSALTPLPTSYLDASKLIEPPCARRSGADVIRFVVKRYDVLPDSPYALRTHLPGFSTDAVTASKAAPLRLGYAHGCDGTT